MRQPYAVARIAATAAFLACALAPAAHAAPAQGTLVKAACPSGAYSSHPCRAVYFYGHDAKRHAFPNARVYATWYADFSGVQTVSDAELAALPLGANVTYRPGAKLVKFLTDPKLYAVAAGGTLRWVESEATAIALFGSAWNTNADDIPDTFYTDYRFGQTVKGDYDVAAEKAAAASPDDALPATYHSLTVKTAGGSFAVQVVKLVADRWKMVSDAQTSADCAANCPTGALKDFTLAAGAQIGMHGTYFCPPEYGDCAGKQNSFYWPFFDTATKTMLNATSLAVHQGPFMTQDANGKWRMYHRTKDFESVQTFESRNGVALSAAVANYPSLLENGAVTLGPNEEKYDEGMKTVRGVRGGIGFDDRYVWLVIAKSATVNDLKDVFVALGAKNAMNLDGGGTAAMIFNGNYVAGPGRPMPNALSFVPR